VSKSGGEMKAGSSNYDVGTKIRITECEDVDLIGLTGTLTHPFAGIEWPGVTYLVGVRLDAIGLCPDNICNLTTEDKFEVIE
jgi:hypothetical protein